MAAIPIFDRVVAVVILGLTASVLVVRAIGVWAEYRRQRRALELLVRSIIEIERPSREHRP